MSFVLLSAAWNVGALQSFPTMGPLTVHRMTNRDVVAAKKIGARYLGTKKELDLGPWSRGVSAEEVKQGTRASPVLREVLTSYARGEYF